MKYSFYRYILKFNKSLINIFLNKKFPVFFIKVTLHFFSKFVTSRRNDRRPPVIMIDKDIKILVNRFHKLIYMCVCVLRNFVDLDIIRP